MSTRFQWTRRFQVASAAAVLMGIAACYAYFQSHAVESSDRIEYLFSGPNNSHYWLRAKDESLLRFHTNPEKQPKPQTFRWPQETTDLGRIFSIDESTFITVRSSELKTRKGVYSHHAILGTAKDGLLTLDPKSKVEIGISELADPLFFQTDRNKFTSILSWEWFGDYEVIELIVAPSQSHRIALQRRDVLQKLSGRGVGERNTPCVFSTSSPNRLITIDPNAARLMDLSTTQGNIQSIKGYNSCSSSPFTLWADVSDDLRFLVTTEVSLAKDQDRKNANLTLGIFELEEFEVKQRAAIEWNLPLPVDLPESSIIDVKVPVKFVDHRSCLLATPIGWGRMEIDASQETLAHPLTLFPFEGQEDSKKPSTIANYRDYIGIVGDSSRPFAIQRAPFSLQRGLHSIIDIGPIDSGTRKGKLIA